MRVLVTGGGGFLGKALVRRLLDRGDEVHSLTRSEQPELLSWGVQVHIGDLADSEAVSRAVAGCELVFHVGAKAGVWGPFEDYYRCNVIGTRNVIAACRQHGVARLVHTSTPSVVHSGGDLEGADESLPVAEHFETAYPETKAEAERMVLEANDESLATVALRPHLIWGPGDNHLVPRLVQRGRAGRLWFIGREDKLVDSTPIDCAVHAHLAAAERLAPGAPCAGKAYFVSQGEPWPMGKLINGILEAAGVAPVTRRMPTWAAYLAGALAESLFRLLRIRSEPPVTRFVAQQMSTAHWYDLSAAKRDLGFEPRGSIEESLKDLRAHFAEAVDSR